MNLHVCANTDPGWPLSLSRTHTHTHTPPLASTNLVTGRHHVFPGALRGPRSTMPGLRVLVKPLPETVSLSAGQRGTSADCIYSNPWKSGIWLLQGIYTTHPSAGRGRVGERQREANRDRGERKKLLSVVVLLVLLNMHTHRHTQTHTDTHRHTQTRRHPQG